MKKRIVFGVGFALALGLLAYLPAQTVQLAPPQGAAPPSLPAPGGAAPPSLPAPGGAAPGGEALIPGEAEAPQVLAYGQMHEAFAQPTDHKPSGSTTVATKPPDPVPETPPEQKPEGDNMQWFSGYWSWDQEKKDFIWISGVYRNVPAGQQFIPGYWHQDGPEWKWVSGFWRSAQQQEVTYVPEPPKTLDNGPNQPPPSPHYVYSPGYWYYTPAGYYWHPGTWVAVQPNLVWVPPHYRWTPCGFVLVGGYWDYPLEQRGLVFAPVYFPRACWVGDPEWCYYPRSVITVGFATDSFFIGPCRHHYYYGAYYGPAWYGRGYVAWVDYGPRCHDPIFCYYRYTYRDDPGWHARLVVTYNDRISGRAAPPAKIINNTTYVIHNTTVINNNTTVVNNINKVNVKGPVQVVGVPGKPAPTVPKLNPVSAAEIQKQVVMNKTMQAATASRQQLEAAYAKQPGGPATGGKAVSVSTTQMKLPAAPVTQAPKTPAPALPGVNTAPKVNPNQPPTPPHTPPKVTPPPNGNPPGLKPGQLPPKGPFPPPKTTTPPGKSPPPPPDHKKDPPKNHVSISRPMSTGAEFAVRNLHFSAFGRDAEGARCILASRPRDGEATSMI